MMNKNQNRSNNQTLKADLFLLHAPSVYDFRERDDVLFAYLSDSVSVNVTSIYEMYPIGFFQSSRDCANMDSIRIPRPFEGRWFDDFTIPSSMIEELTLSQTTERILYLLKIREFSKRS